MRVLPNVTGMYCSNVLIGVIAILVDSGSSAGLSTDTGKIMNMISECRHPALLCIILILHTACYRSVQSRLKRGRASLVSAMGKKGKWPGLMRLMLSLVLTVPMSQHYRRRQPFLSVFIFYSLRSETHACQLSSLSSLACFKRLHYASSVQT